VRVRLARGPGVGSPGVLRYAQACTVRVNGTEGGDERPEEQHEVPGPATEIAENLAGRGLDVMPAVVNDALESGAQRVAEQLGVTPLTALKYANPQRIAAEIADAAENGMRGIRPLRDGRTAELPAWTAGKLIAG
jgi:hypothetical protein